jgi:5-methylcytosine-specific restriction endonuclease McrA
MPNGNDRGSAADRRARLAWIFRVFGVDGIVTCTFCAVPLLPEDCTVDRIVPGCKGGRYVRGNIRPACKPCQDEQGGRIGHEQRLARC